MGKIIELRKEEKNFLLKFTALFAIPFALIHVLPLGFLTNVIAWIEASLLKASGFNAVLDGSNILLSTQSFLIVPECTGLVMITLLLALLYATKINRERRRKTTFVFVPFLFGFNIVRVFATLSVGSVLNAVDALHFALWFVDSAIVLLIWAHAAEIKL